MSGSALALRGLEVTLEGRRIVGPLDLELEVGAHALLIGPSGCGKSTLLRAIAGLVEPSAGTIAIFGRPASEPGRVLIAPERREIGMLFQGGALWPHMSVGKTLRFVLRHAGHPPSDERVATLLAQVQLTGMEERMPAGLSGGEKQRLALARAIATRPKLLLLDEPLGPLDAELRADLLRTLADLHDELGWTTIHVTHDPGESRAHATRILRMKGGRMEEGASER